MTKSTTGDELRAYADAVIEGAMTAAGNAYVGQVGRVKQKGRKRRSAGMFKQNPETAPVQNHFKKGNAERYKYPALSDEYAAQKAREYPGRPMLVATGRLKKSASKADVKVSLQRGRIDITWNAAPAYGAYHFAGEGKNPKRDWATPDNEDLEDIVGVMQDFIDTQASLENGDLRRRGASAERRLGLA